MASTRRRPQLRSDPPIRVQFYGGDAVPLNHKPSKTKLPPGFYQGRRGHHPIQHFNPIGSGLAPADEPVPMIVTKRRIDGVLWRDIMPTMVWPLECQIITAEWNERSQDWRFAP